MPKQNDKNNNEKKGFWVHFRGILDECWTYLLGIAFLVFLIIWLFLAHAEQIRGIFGFADWENVRDSSYAFIKQGFEPIELPKETTKIPDAKCQAPEGGLCYPPYR